MKVYDRRAAHWINSKQIIQEITIGIMFQISWQSVYALPNYVTIETGAPWGDRFTYRYPKAHFKRTGKRRKDEKWWYDDFKDTVVLRI